MDYLYSLYDALVSINVPNDKARAVVDAMERDMGTTIATKTDLDMLRFATKADLQLLRQELLSSLASRDDLAQLRTEVREEFGVVRQEIGTLRQEIGTLRQDFGTLRQDFSTLRQDNVLIRKEMELLASRLVIQLGSMLVVGFGLTIGTLKFFLG
jgi:HAMP domain-containing protein